MQNVVFADVLFDDTHNAAEIVNHKVKVSCIDSWIYTMRGWNSLILKILLQINMH